MYTKLLEDNSFLLWILSSFEYLSHLSLQIRIVSAETIRGNTVYKILSHILLFKSDIMWKPIKN